ncbi:hypothetical protein [Sediminibacillus albus]|uniref:Uncharacterized protein n=1 Tax=Sediminibacillus albus TaxID=407036 RepID=A0A1G8XFW7_9BACI|nr:hypothetical protein [Sediminibacillus albus]SDJ89498.1 hypothetical protein SAMN05216243_1342 [Sediminibacillus albus]
MYRETIIIEGSVDGMRFSKPILLSYNPNQETVEEAIINFYNSQAATFDELAVQRGWGDCYWTFPSYSKVV